MFKRLNFFFFFLENSGIQKIGISKIFNVLK